MSVNETQLRIESALWAIRQCWPEMHADAGWGNGQHAAPGSRTPEPVGLLADRAAIAANLGYWSARVIRLRVICAVEPVDPTDPMSTTAFLLDHAPWLGAHRVGRVAAGHLERTANRCELWAKGLHVRRIAIAPCPHCEGVLYAILRQSEDVLPTTIRCDLDGHEYPPHGWQTLGRTIRGLHPDGVANLRAKLRHDAS